MCANSKSSYETAHCAVSSELLLFANMLYTLCTCCGSQAFYILALSETPNEESSRSTPVGPVAGGIMGCFLVLALSVYCYRHRIHRNSHQYISTLPENQNRISNYYETDDIDPVEEPGNGRLLLLTLLLQSSYSCILEHPFAQKYSGFSCTYFLI